MERALVSDIASGINLGRLGVVSERSECEKTVLTPPPFMKMETSHETSNLKEAPKSILTTVEESPIGDKSLGGVRPKIYFWSITRTLPIHQPPIFYQKCYKGSHVAGFSL